MKDRKYGIEHRQWRLDESALGTPLCPHPGGQGAAASGGVPTCQGTLVKEELTGVYTIVSVRIYTEETIDWS